MHGAGGRTALQSTPDSPMPAVAPQQGVSTRRSCACPRTGVSCKFVRTSYPWRCSPRRLANFSTRARYPARSLGAGMASRKIAISLDSSPVSQEAFAWAAKHIVRNGDQVRPRRRFRQTFYRPIAAQRAYWQGWATLLCSEGPRSGSWKVHPWDPGGRPIRTPLQVHLVTVIQPAIKAELAYGAGGRAPLVDRGEVREAAGCAQLWRSRCQPHTL